MSKRANDAGDLSSPKARRQDGESTRQSAPPDNSEMGEFEDQFEDEFESEDEVIVAGEDGLPDDEMEDDDKDAAMELDNQVFLPSRQKLGKDEILEPDPSAYEMLHTLNVNWPCLSFDVLPDALGDERRSFPASVYLVTGTQAERAKDNEIMVLKLSGLHKMHQNKDDSDDEDEDSDTEDDPILESRSLPTTSTTNRIRLSPLAETTGEYLTASMAESGDVLVWDVTPHYKSFDTPGSTISKADNLPKATIKSHKGVEGYAIDWSPLIRTGALLTGDNSGKIYLTTRTDAGQWKTDASPYTGHTGSVEELQWSPSQNNVFASGSSDGTVRIWDTRSKKHRPQLKVDVSSSDINVMSWNKRVDFLLATGADDGVWGVWDLRTFASAGSASTPTPTASFTFHQQPITSIEFHPTEDSIVSVASADNTVTLWDLSVELDDEESKDTGGVDVPPQLMFCHYMKDAKEVHWQRQMPGTLVTTGAEGFGVWKTISV